MSATLNSVCPICGGNKRSAKTTFSVDKGETLIVIRDVPATVCAQCGEEWIDDETAQKVERIVDEAQAKNAQVEIVALDQVFTL